MAISKNIPITDKNQMLKLIIISITWSGRERNFDKHEMVQLSCSPLFLGGKDYYFSYLYLERIDNHIQTLSAIPYNELGMKV